MNAAEFAAAHGDSAKWTATDFEVEMNLAEIDAYRTTPDPQTAAPLTPAA